jgi:type I restriction enzyme M protein
MINIIFCKIFDERHTKPDMSVRFCAGANEDHGEVKKRIESIFEEVKSEYSDVINKTESIDLDPKSLYFVVGEMQGYCLLDCQRDAVASAFELFVGPSLKGAQGQFFTPRNVVRMIVDIIDPGPLDKILDPACGSGGFLAESMKHVWSKIEEKGTELCWQRDAIEVEKQKVARDHVRGVDKDISLSKIAKAYLAILGDGRSGVFCDNSLSNPKNWGRETCAGVSLESFDVVVTNPPFGKKLAIDDESILGQYELGYKWNQDEDGIFSKDATKCVKQTPQILFIERCLSFLKPGGKLGIVLLESIFGMPKYRYVVDFIRKKSRIKAIVALPEDLFQPNTHAKCCVLICEKFQKGERPDERNKIFMADVKWCGHDSRGNPTYTIGDGGNKIPLDEIPEVAEKYKENMGL